MAVVESTISVPAEDAAVQLAFEQLDARLNAWRASMQQLGAVLRRLDAEPVEAESPAAESVVQPAPDEAQPAAKHREASASTAAKSAKIEPAPVAEPPAVPLPVVSPAESTEPQPAAAAEEEPAVDDDEALLATLDAETAKVIRVRRRLTVGHKSVRELLAECNAEQGRPVIGESGKKSWWRRGK